MGRYSTGAYILDQLKTLSIADLKRMGYMKPGRRYGNVRWSCKGETTGTVTIVVEIGPACGYVDFSYIHNHEQEYRYRVQLTSIPTNLGIGRRWYFICPQTGKRCAKLFLGNGYFQHRTGIPGALYSSQTESGFYRSLAKYWRDYDRQFTPYMKTHYRGKPTKRYLLTRIAARKADRLGALLLASMKG